MEPIDPLTLLANIFSAYHRSCDDPKSKIPTPLHAAIARAHLELGNLHRQEESQEDKVNAYANVMIKRDKERAAWERDQSGELDMSPRGGRLRPGS